MYHLYCNVKGNNDLVDLVQEAIRKAKLTDRTIVEKSDLKDDFELYRGYNPQKKNLHSVAVIDEDFVPEGDPKHYEFVNHMMSSLLKYENGVHPVDRPTMPTQKFTIKLVKNRNSQWSSTTKNGTTEYLVTNSPHRSYTVDDLVEVFKTIDQVIKKEFDKTDFTEDMQENIMRLVKTLIRNRKKRNGEEYQQARNSLIEQLTVENIKSIYEEELMKGLLMMLLESAHREELFRSKLELILKTRQDLNLNYEYEYGESQKTTLMALAVEKELYEIAQLIKESMPKKYAGGM